MIFLSSKDVAELLCVSQRLIEENAKTGKYGDRIRYVKGKGRGGKQLQIALCALPENAQQKYLVEKLNQEAVTICQSINRPFDNCNEVQKKSAIQKLKAIEAYKLFEREQVEKSPKFSKTQCKNEFVAEWNKNHFDFQLSQTTLYRMLNDYKEEGITGLIDSRGGHNKDRSSIPPEIWKQFKSIFLTQMQPSIKQCYDDIRLTATEKGITIPNYPVFKYHVKHSIPRPEYLLGRYGKKAYTDNCEPTLERDYTLLKPNQMWVADGHIWDVFVTVIENGKEKVKTIRLWGVYWMDMRTRKMLSYRLCVGNPNADTVLLAFREAVLKYGIPEEAILDNGKDYKTKDLFNTKKYEQLTLDYDTRFNPTQLFDDEKVRTKFFIKPIASQMGMIIHFTNPYNAKAKPIERAFGTFESKFGKRFASYLGRNTQNRPEQLKNMPMEKHPTFCEFKDLHDKFISEIYNNAAHTGEGMNGRTPNQAYDEMEFELRKSTPEVMRLWLMRTTELLTISKNGINIKGIRYYTSRFVKMQGKEKVFARYDPEDMSYAEVYDTQDRYLFSAFRSQKMSFSPTKEEYKEMGRRKKEALEITKAGMSEPPEGYGTVAYIEKMMDLQIAENKRKGLVERIPDVPIKIVRNPILEENARKAKAMREENSAELFKIETEQALKPTIDTYEESEYEKESDLLFEFFRNA